MNRKNTSKSPRMLQVRQDRGYDCAYVKGKKIMLGRTGSPEAEANFRKLQVQVLTDPTLSAPASQQVMVDNLCLAYLKYAEEADPAHFCGIKTAIKILLKHFAGQAVDGLDSRSFLFLQKMFVQHGVSRQYCNMLMGYIRAMLKWGILHKLVSHQVYWEAKLVPALRKGKTKAYEKPKRQDVPDAIIERTLAAVRCCRCCPVQD